MNREQKRAEVRKLQRMGFKRDIARKFIEQAEYAKQAEELQKKAGEKVEEEQSTSSET